MFWTGCWWWTCPFLAFFVGSFPVLLLLEWWTTGRGCPLTPNNTSLSLKWWEIIQNLGIRSWSGQRFRANPVKPEGKLHQLGLQVVWSSLLHRAGEPSGVGGGRWVRENNYFLKNSSSNRQVVKCRRKHLFWVWTEASLLPSSSWCNILLCYINLHLGANADVWVEDLHIFPLCSDHHHVHPVSPSTMRVPVVFCYSAHMITILCLSFVFAVYDGSLCYICSRKHSFNCTYTSGRVKHELKISHLLSEWFLIQSACKNATKTDPN